MSTTDSVGALLAQIVNERDSFTPQANNSDTFSRYLHTRILDPGLLLSRFALACF